MEHNTSGTLQQRPHGNKQDEQGKAQASHARNGSYGHVHLGIVLVTPWATQWRTLRQHPHGNKQDEQGKAQASHARNGSYGHVHLGIVLVTPMGNSVDGGHAAC
ncbi:hypothetical protein EPH_0027090 [Eimeria praecox]|uniref:Uncharacterized protein n=1 Tax=Eimeria praecox TaxID=51316 RepID=U6HAD1_9EIME|nr:hypothetical protein EPH_0027090 [Eimeria praecox]